MDEKKPPEESPKPPEERPEKPTEAKSEATPEAKPKPKPKPKPAKKGVDEEKLRAPVPSKTLDRLKLVHGEFVEEATFHCGVPIVRVNPEKIVEICRFLKEDGNCRMTLLANLCGVDMIGANRSDPRFDVVYNLFSPDTGERITVRAAATEENGIDSVSSVWRTADWHEREAYDMFGIKFHGHPDLRRILMPYDFDGFPLRKDFPLEGRAKDHGYWRRPEDGEGRDLPE